jgi:hypothetical protein
LCLRLRSSVAPTERPVWLRPSTEFASQSISRQHPYNFNPGTFLANKDSAQHRYLNSERLKVRKEGGFEPVFFLLTDYGDAPYSTTIECKLKRYCHR